MFLSLYTTRLILSELGASDFGVFNIVGGAIAMLGFLNTAMAGATQRFISYYKGQGDKEKQRKIFNISIILHCSIALLMGIVLIIVGTFIFNGILNIAVDKILAAKIIYGSLIISAFFTVVTVPYEAIINANENMFYYAIIGIVESILKLSIAVILIFITNNKLIVYGVLMAGIPLVTMTMMCYYCHRNYIECRLSVRKYWDKEVMKDMSRFAGWNFFGTMSSLVGNYGNVIILNHFFGTVINAAYSIANQLNGQLMVFSTNLVRALNPVIIKKQGEGDQDRMLYYSLFGNKISSYLTVLILIPCIIEAPFVLKIWLKNIPEWTIVFVKLQFIRTILEQLTVTFNTVLAANGDIKLLNISSIVSNLIPLPLVVILFKYNFSPYYIYIVGIIFMVIINSVFKVFFCVKLCSMKFSQLWHIVLYPVFLSVCLSLLTGILLQYILYEGVFRLLLNIIITLIGINVIGYLTLEKNEKLIAKNFYKTIEYKIINTQFF
jgi:O-antigen/teichoic acid export membrane protein